MPPAEAPAGIARAAAAAAAAAAATTAARSAAAAALAAEGDDGKEVFLEIRACACWADVLDVVGDEGPRLSARNTTTALRRLASLTAAAPPGEAAALRAHPGLATLLAIVERQLPSLNAFQLANCLQDLSLLGASPSAAFHAAAEAAVEARLPDFNARDLSSLLSAFSASRRRPAERTLALLAGRLQGAVAAGALDAKSLSVVLKALAMLGHRPAPALMGALLSQIGAQLPALKPIEARRRPPRLFFVCVLGGFCGFRRVFVGSVFWKGFGGGFGGFASLEAAGLGLGQGRRAQQGGEERRRPRPHTQPASDPSTPQP